MSLRRVGAAFYLAKLYSILTGALFILLITRNLSVEEFGAWSTISALLSYATAFTFVNFWTTRLRASGAVEASPTALFLSLAFAVPSSLAYLTATMRAASVFHLPQGALLISVFYVPALYALSALYAAAFGAQPMSAAISEVIFETVKLLTAAGAFVLRRVNLSTALFAVLAGYLVQVMVLALHLRNDLRRGFSRSIAARILSLVPANALSVAPPLIGGMDVLLLSVLVSNEAVAYYTVVYPFTNAILYSHLLARGLYPALLAGATDSEQLLEEALRLVTLLAIPGAIGTAVTAPFLLYVLKPEYSIAAPVLTIAALTAATGSISAVLSDAVQGLERRDLEGASLREVFRSRIFSVQLLACVRAAVGISSIALAALTVKEPVAAAALCKSVWLVLTAVEASILASWARARRVLLRASRSALKFTAAALVAAFLAYLARPDRLRELAVAVTVSATAYFALVYLLDPWFKRLASGVLSRLRPTSTLKQSGEKS